MLQLDVPSTVIFPGKSFPVELAIRNRTIKPLCGSAIGWVEAFHMASQVLGVRKAEGFTGWVGALEPPLVCFEVFIEVALAIESPFAV
jgi:hypothetical protein